MSAGCPAKARLTRDIDAMQTMSAQIAARACQLPTDLRDDVLVELLTSLIVSTGSVIAVSARGDDATVALILDVTTLRITESAADAAKMIRAGVLDVPGATS